MSVSAEVQRTLVKSPPELWTELSDASALTRHLGELGEIRVIQVEPETKVEWEADGASGMVQLKQSGWGTKVTLSVTREGPVVEGPPEAAAEPEADVEPVLDAEPEIHAEPEIQAEPEIHAEVSAEVEVEVEAVEAEAVEAAEVPENPTIAVATEPETLPEAETPAEPDPRPGFFARLFRRRKTKLALAEPAEPELVAVAEPQPAPPAMAAPELEFVLPPEPEPAAPEPISDISAELAALEAEMVEQTTALLTGVLDRLGAAHHRPFSRG
jgi:hypothetical protein